MTVRVQRHSSMLVATDFSEGAAVAARAAARLARAWGTPVELVHVVIPERYAADLLPGSERAMARRIDEAARTDLAHWAQEIFGGLEVSVAPLRGTHPAEAVARRAEEQAHGLCVVGTHGRTGLSRMLIGSVAEAVVRLAPCDVLCIPPASDPASLPPRSILACTDLSRNAERGIEVAAELAREGEAKLTLLNVIDVTRPVIPAAAFAENAREKTQREAALAELRERLGELAVGAKVFADVSPADAIGRFAADQDVDLVVLSTHERTGWSRLHIGSVAERVVRHARCPTLIVRARGERGFRRHREAIRGERRSL